MLFGLSGTTSTLSTGPGFLSGRAGHRFAVCTLRGPQVTVTSTPGWEAVIRNRIYTLFKPCHEKIGFPAAQVQRPARILNFLTNHLSRRSAIKVIRLQKCLVI